MPLRMRTVDEHGSPTVDPFDLVLKDPNTREPILDAVVTCRPMPQSEWRRLLRKFTTREADPGSRQMVERVDVDGAHDALICETVLEWRGIESRNGRPVPCTDQTKLELDTRIKAQIITAVLGSEGVAAQEASFREPAHILPVAP